MTKGKQDQSHKKEKREIKTGKRGGPKVRLNKQQRILVNRNGLKGVKSVVASPWLGASSFAQPFDAEQARKNREVGL